MRASSTPGAYSQGPHLEGALQQQPIGGFALVADDILEGVQTKVAREVFVANLSDKETVCKISGTPRHFQQYANSFAHIRGT